MLPDVPNSAEKLLNIFKELEDNGVCWFQLFQSVIDMYLAVTGIQGVDGNIESPEDLRVEYYIEKDEEGFEAFQTSVHHIFEVVRSESFPCELFSIWLTGEFCDWDEADVDPKRLEETNTLPYKIFKHVLIHNLEFMPTFRFVARFDASLSQELLTQLLRLVFSLSHIQVACMNQLMTSDCVSNSGSLMFALRLAKFFQDRWKIKALIQMTGTWK